jgi:long-subunit acyl-CoA synthetase (AMP-forming)
VLLDGQPEGPTELTWDQLLARGGDSTDAELDQRWQGRAASELAVLIYTSGTTGLPKAVMLTHRNVTFSADTAIRDLGLDHHEHLLSYLPLSHIAEQLLSLHGPACGGFTVSFCPELNELGDYLRQVRPTVFFGVPRVWEKMQQKMREARRNASPLQQRIAAVARSIGLEASRARAEGRRPPLLYPLARKLIFSRVREKLGLDRAWLQASGAAAISRECLDYFASLDLPIYEVYGMSEVSGASTANVPHSVRFGTVGRPLAGTELKLADDGEILMRGPHVFAGYYKDEAATKEALSDDGWLRSGDIGELDADGFLRITDRKKDLFKTAGGKYIAPQPIEARLKAIPGVALAVVVGDARKYPAALLTLDPEAFPGRSLADAAADPAVRARLEEGVEEVNRSLASYEKLKRFGVLAAEFTIEGGELTPSLKVRRRAVASKYASDIDALYPAE